MADNFLGRHHVIHLVGIDEFNLVLGDHWYALVPVLLLLLLVLEAHAVVGLLLLAGNLYLLLLQIDELVTVIGAELTVVVAVLAYHVSGWAFLLDLPLHVVLLLL